MERPARLRGAHTAAWNQPQLRDVITDAALGPIDQRPAGLGRLEHRDRHMDDRRPDLWSSRPALQLVMRPKTVELRQVAEPFVGFEFESRSAEEYARQ